MRKWERCCRPPSPQRDAPSFQFRRLLILVIIVGNFYHLLASDQFCHKAGRNWRNFATCLPSCGETSAQLPPSGHRKLYNGSLSGLILGLVQEDIVIRLWCSGNYSTLEMILTLRHKAAGLNYTWQIFSIFLPSIQLCDQRGVGGFIMNLGHFCLSLPISMTRFWTHWLSLKGAYFVITF